MLCHLIQIICISIFSDLPNSSKHVDKTHYFFPTSICLSKRKKSPSRDSQASGIYISTTWTFISAYQDKSQHNLISRHGDFYLI